ncbi:MAG: patatin-like phospholipase family protein [Candidatus Anstonellales archaeon]
MVNIIRMLRKPEPLVPYDYPRAITRMRISEQEERIAVFKKPLLDHTQTDFFGRVDKTRAVKLKEGDGRIFVVMSGAGQRFWAYLGFLQALDQHNIPISVYIGTSGGALASMLAALEYYYEDVIEKLDGHMEYLFYDFDFGALLKGKNIHKGERIINYIRESLPERMRYFSYASNFYAVASAVNVFLRHPNGALEYKKIAPVVFGAGFTEDFPIEEGVYASMCLPNFEPVVVEESKKLFGVSEAGKKYELISGNRELGMTYLVDGGYTSHKPLEVAVNLYDPEKDVILFLTPSADFKPLNINLINSLFTLPLTVDMEGEFSRKMKNFADENIMVVYLQDWVADDYDITNIKPNDFSKIRLLYNAGKSAAEGWMYHYWGISLFI